MYLAAWMGLRETGLRESEHLLHLVMPYRPRRDGAGGSQRVREIRVFQRWALSRRTYGERELMMIIRVQK